MHFIEAIENATEKTILKQFAPMQPGDAPITYANCDELKKLTGFQSKTPVQQGVQSFVKWYVHYHGL